jgi:hypothetical protein
LKARLGRLGRFTGILILATSLLLDGCRDDKPGQARETVAGTESRQSQDGEVQPVVYGGGYIAYSTAPGEDQRTRKDPRDDSYLTGSAVFIVHEGSEPKLVAGREDGKRWNVCPAWSPDGDWLAFGQKSPEGRAIRIVGLSRVGEIQDTGYAIKTPESKDAPCPLWSRDGQRLAYVVKGEVIVRKEDGSTIPAGEGDPTLEDFSDPAWLPSPTGDLIAHNDCKLEVARPDHSDKRDLEVAGSCIYALAAWSPDGRRVLVMRDISGIHFTMLAVSMDAPADVVPIVEGVRVNHPRSWPGHGDVSWQPLLSFENP